MANGGESPDEQMTTMVHAVGVAAESRVPLEIALAALAEERYHPRLAKIAQELSVMLAAGATIDEAAERLGRRLPAEIRGLLRAGIECGDLAGTFEHFAQQRLAAARAARRLRSAVAYPLVIVVILVPVLLFLSMYVVPMFGDLYGEFNLTLPAITEMVLQSAEQMPGVIGALAVVLIGMPALLRVLGGRWLLHRVRATTPLVGRLWLWSGQREFAAMLASFLDLRLPVESAIAHTSEVISDRNLAGACRRVRQRLESGQSLSASLSHSMHFDRSLVALVAWGERHNLVPEALRMAAEVFDDRIEQHASFVRRLLPPVALVTVATVMFLVIVGLMSPLVRLIEALA